MRKTLMLVLLILLVPIKGFSACSGSGCCTISSGVVTWPDNSSCSLEPDDYGITMFNMYLCTSEPSAPTTSAAAGLTAAGCVMVFESTSGSAVTVTSSGSSTAFPGATFYRPAPGTYTHGYMLIDNVFRIKFDKEFNTSITGGSSGTGKYCATKDGSANEDTGGAVVCSSSDNLTAGTWGAILTSFDGVSSFDATATMTNLNGTGANISGYLVESDGTLGSSNSDVDKLVGIQSFATAVKITKDLKSFDVKFGVNQGTTIWDDAGAGGNTIEAGSGPFQAIITPINY
jgi:hypothetical protein